MCILLEEMRRYRATFRHESEIWTQRSTLDGLGPDVDISPELADGLRIFALEQADIARRRAKSAAKVWLPLLRDNGQPPAVPPSLAPSLPTPTIPPFPPTISPAAPSIPPTPSTALTSEVLDSADSTVPGTETDPTIADLDTTGLKDRLRPRASAQSWFLDGTASESEDDGDFIVDSNFWESSSDESSSDYEEAGEL